MLLFSSQSPLFFWLSALFIPTITRGVSIELSSKKIVLENSNGGCIGIDGGEARRSARLMLVNCDDRSEPRTDTVWHFDETNGVFRSDLDDEYCWTVKDGARVLKLHKCEEVQSSQQFFDFYESESSSFDDNDNENKPKGQIRFKDNRCVVHRGINANVDIDLLIVKPCKSIRDDNSKEWNIVTEMKTKDPLMEFSDPFDVNLPYFSANITKGYSDPNLADFEKDLAGAAAMVLNKAIQNNLKNPFPMLYSAVSEMSMIERFDDMVPADAEVSDSNRGEEVTETAYETNVQEESVDEADIMKADANNIYASYGDYILVWDKNGNKKTELKMPKVVAEGDRFDGRRPFEYFYEPKARIDSLLLIPGYLVVFVSGYGNALRDEILGKRPAILYDYLGTQLRVYSTTGIEEGELELKAVKNINGRFVDARLVGGRYVHAVTTSSINIYRYLINPLDRNSYFWDLSDEEYFVAAQKQARDRNLPEFIRDMREELSGMDGDFPNFLQINRWQKDVPDNERILDVSFSDGVANNVAWVTSFDVTSADADGTEGALRVSTSSFMTPYSWLHMYGTNNEIILATEGWNWNVDIFGQEESTYLVALALDGASTTFTSVGTIAGHLLNSFALDIHEGELRVATTIQKRWRWGPFVVDEIFMMAEEEEAEPPRMMEDPEIEANEPFVLPFDPPRENENEFIQESSTENYVITFNLQGSQSGEMEEIGRVKIGEPNESIRSIRFFDDFAYVVTFERTDPFYVIGLGDGVPTKLGEFKLNGFSSYLHPLTPDNKLLIGVGQNATDNGRITGLMITIFNATVPQNPVAVVSHTIENDDNRYSSSDAEWEHKSFRYLQKSGKLILPLYESYQTIDKETGSFTFESFQGFAIFNVTAETIDENYRVSHKHTSCVYCSGYLPPRSFVYEGNLMTVRDSVVKSTDLDSGGGLWSFEIEIDGVDKNDLCCPYYDR